jgi:hypothetical protein
MPPFCKTAVLVLLAATGSIPFARCEETLVRAPDGSYLVELNSVTVALPEEDPQHKLTYFAVSTPPGTRIFDFYLTDLAHDPNRYAPRLRSSEWSSVKVSSKDHKIIGVPVVRGLYSVGIHVGVDANCEAWTREWSRLRDIALDLATDQFGWTRQEFPRSPPWTMFIKFLDEGDRRASRYYAVDCDFSGGCSTKACRDGLTTWIAFNSSNKPRGEDFSVTEFDQQITSGKNVLEHLLVNRSVNLSHP